MTVRALVAGDVQATNRIRTVLREYSCSFVLTIAEAQIAITKQVFDIVILALPLHETRILEPVGRLAKQARSRGAGLFCVSAEPGLRIPAALSECTRAAVRAIGALDFVDLGEPPPGGLSRLRDALTGAVVRQVGEAPATPH